MSFFERLGGLAKNIGDRTSEAIEVSKLNARIGAEKATIEDCLRQIGEHFYQRYLVGEMSDSSVEELFTVIDGHKKTIAEIEAEIEKLKVEPAADTPEPAVTVAAPVAEGVACPACAAVNAIGTKFCSECGGKLEASPESAAPLCPGCGAPITADAKFCGECGHRFG